MARSKDGQAKRPLRHWRSELNSGFTGLAEASASVPDGLRRRGGRVFRAETRRSPMWHPFKPEPRPSLPSERIDRAGPQRDGFTGEGGETGMPRRYLAGANLRPRSPPAFLRGFIPGAASARKRVWPRVRPVAEARQAE